jgi:DNA-binding transcriptional LysR family regulator
VRLSTASYALSRDAVLAGLGVALLPSYYIAAELRSGRLEQVLDAWTPPEASVTAVYASRELVAPKVRAFIDLLAAHVARRPLFEMEG